MLFTFIYINYKYNHLSIQQFNNYQNNNYYLFKKMELNYFYYSIV